MDVIIKSDHFLAINPDKALKNSTAAQKLLIFVKVYDWLL